MLTKVEIQERSSTLALMLGVADEGNPIHFTALATLKGYPSKKVALALSTLF